jgi:chromosome segregation ATPase
VAFWIALTVLVVGVVAGLVYAVLRGFSLWRQLKRTGASFSAETARIADASEQIQVHLDRAEASSARLREASERLQLARARLDVQLQALREARHTLRRLLWFMPGVP